MNIRTASASRAQGADAAPAALPRRVLVAPLVGTGALMAAYLLLRPYGDTAGSDTLDAARAFASRWWVVSHLLGVLALASLGRLALRTSDVLPGVPARLARTSGLVGMVLVLPYYGAETFALHTVGRAALAQEDLTLLGLVADVQGHPVALATFALGLVLLGVAGLLVALAWQRSHGSPAAWPLGALAALVLPQFYLPPVGRMAFGVLYAVAAGIFLLAVLRHSQGEQPAGRAGLHT